METELRERLPPSFQDSNDPRAIEMRRFAAEQGFASVAGRTPSAPELEKRMFVDDSVARADCDALVDLAKRTVVPGDGYEGNEHPFTPLETFSGVALDGRLVPSDAAIMARVAKQLRDLTRRYYGVSDLWLDYVHLVRRNAVKGADAEAPQPVVSVAASARRLMSGITGANSRFAPKSHGWHVDNEADHLWFRTHTAILFLNDDFEGGNLMFRDDDAVVRPQPGRMVAFTSGPENPHAVSALHSGSRYVFNCWFSTANAVRGRCLLRSKAGKRRG